MRQKLTALMPVIRYFELECSIPGRASYKTLQLDLPYAINLSFTPGGADHNWWNFLSSKRNCINIIVINISSAAGVLYSTSYRDSGWNSMGKSGEPFSCTQWNRDGNPRVNDPMIMMATFHCVRERVNLMHHTESYSLFESKRLRCWVAPCFCQLQMKIIQNRLHTVLCKCWLLQI